MWTCSYQQVGSVHVQRLLHLELPLTLQSMLGWPVQHRPHIVTHVTELSFVGRHQTAETRAQSVRSIINGCGQQSDPLWSGRVSPGCRQLKAKMEAVRFISLQQEAAVSICGQRGS